MVDTFVDPMRDTRRVEDGLPLVAEFPFWTPDALQQDDAMLDGWLASLTPDRFEAILDSLADTPVMSGAAAG